MNRKLAKTCVLIAALVLLVAQLSFASSDSAPDPSEKNWQFNLVPLYLWGINLDGDLSAGTDKIPAGNPLTIPVDVPFDDVYDSLEAAFTIHFEGMYKNKWGFLMNVDYFNLANDFTNAQGIGLSADLEVAVAEFSGIYRVPYDVHNFDALLGIRYYDLNTELALLGGPNLVDNTQDWVDPFIGGRWSWNFAQGWSLIARGDIGGFGAGSDFAWQALGLIEWQPFQHVSFLAGYKALDVDYEDGSGRDFFKLDVTVHGPVLGVNFKF